MQNRRLHKTICTTIIQDDFELPLKQQLTSLSHTQWELKSEKVQFRKDFKVVVHTSEIDIFDEQNDMSYSISLWGHS